jgi:HlyD family secretion protein
MQYYKKSSDGFWPALRLSVRSMMNQQNHPSVQEIEQALGLSADKRRNRLGKRLIMAAVLAAFALAGYWLYARQETAADAISYETVAATTVDLVVTVTATGTIQPITQVDIGSEASGVVRDVLVAENATVKSGDVLAVLDTSRLLAQRARIEAQVKSAEARLLETNATTAERRLIENRQKGLRQKGLSTAQDMEAAEAASLRADAALDGARADLAAAKADLAIIDADISKTSIVSPINGVVLKRSVEPGQTVASSLQAPVLFQVAQDLTRIQLEAAVDEADIGRVQVGQNANFTVDAYRGRSFPARIERLSYAPETVDGVVTYKAILSAANDDLSLRPGMTATARINIEEYKQALTVANEALRYAPPLQQEAESFSITRMFMPRFPRSQRGKAQVAADGTRAIYVLKAGKPSEVRVKTGATDGKVTRIVAGDLKPGDDVITAQKQARK